MLNIVKHLAESLVKSLAKSLREIPHFVRHDTKRLGTIFALA